MDKQSALKKIANVSNPSHLEKSPIISLQNIYKSYSSGDVEFTALYGASLNIYEGEFVAIIGPSGSGKSTLMNIIGCLDRFDKGEYFLAGESVKTMTDAGLAKWRGQKIGFVFQSFNLLNKFTVLENVALPSLYVNIENPIKKAREILEKVGLKDKLYNTPLQLSGGQRQRVAIARALIANPSILLADEPTGNLDSTSGKSILSLFKKLNQEGTTIIIITHDQTIAGYAQRQIKIIDGKISG